MGARHWSIAALTAALLAGCGQGAQEPQEPQETVGAERLTETDAVEVADEIDRLLREIVTAYESGEAGAAAELSAEAYLDNYEVIEAEVVESAPEVNEELEPLLGAELRERMAEGAPVAEIKRMTRRARSLLDRAVRSLEEGNE